MKKGQIVMCVKHHCDGHNPYLTDGKQYTVTSGKGDCDFEGDSIHGDDIFQVMGDHDGIVYCCYPNDLHATWELVSE